MQRRNEGRDWPLYAQTMIGRKRTRNVRELVERVIAERVPGDLIEAGCWRGGTVIMMRGILKAHGIDDRTVYAADSFEGLPEPNPERFPADSADINYTADELAVSIEEVQAQPRPLRAQGRRRRVPQGLVPRHAADGAPTGAGPWSASTAISTSRRWTGSPTSTRSCPPAAI